jgi:hypothetical protein
LSFFFPAPLSFNRHHHVSAFPDVESRTPFFALVHLAMLVLFETALGFCLFKFNEGKFSSEDLWKEFETPERANAA